MPAQKGKDLLIKIDDGAGGFVTVAGLRTRQTRLQRRDRRRDARRIGRALARAPRPAPACAAPAITGSGVFKDEASDARLRQIFFDGDVRTYQVIVPDFGRIEGPFQITGLEYRGDHAGEVTFEMAFESAGALTFTAI